MRTVIASQPERSLHLEDEHVKMEDFSDGLRKNTLQLNTGITDRSGQFGHWETPTVGLLLPLMLLLLEKSTFLNSFSLPICPHTVAMERTMSKLDTVLFSLHHQALCLLFLCPGRCFQRSQGRCHAMLTPSGQAVVYHHSPFFSHKNDLTLYSCKFLLRQLQQQGLRNGTTKAVLSPKQHR